MFYRELKAHFTIRDASCERVQLNAHVFYFMLIAVKTVLSEFCSPVC